MNHITIVNRKDGIDKPSIAKLKFVDSLFQYYITHALWILLQNCGGKLNPTKIKKIHVYTFKLSQKVKAKHPQFYNQLLTKPTKSLKEIFKKLRNSSYKEMSEKIWDPDFCQIYKFLKIICNEQFHLKILKELIPNIDFSRTLFEIDIISHNVFKWRKND